MGTGPSDAQYVAVLVLLGVAHGAPDFAPTFFRALMSAREWKFEGKPIIDFGGFLNSATLEGAFASQDPTLREGWRLLIGELSKFAKNQKQEIPMAVLRKWSPAVVRYTFQIGRLSEEVASQAARG
jgi:hypothetical protein